MRTTPDRPISISWRFQLVAVGATYAVCCGIPGMARGQPEAMALTPAGFLVEYRRALKELQAEYRDVQIEGVDHTSTQLSYMSRDGSERLRLKREKPDYFDRVFVHTNTRGFQVRKVAADGNYMLENVFDTGDAPGVVANFRGRIRESPYYAGGMGWLPDVIESAHFRITDVSNATEAGELLVKATFEYLPPGRPSTKGWILLNPAGNWVIRRYSHTTEGAVGGAKKKQSSISMHTDGWVRYIVQDGRLAPAETSHTLEVKGTAKPFINHLVISRFTFGHVSAAEFTLDAFGLGDYARTRTEITERRTYRATTAAALALLFAVALFLMGWRIQHGRKHGERPLGRGPREMDSHGQAT